MGLESDGLEVADTLLGSSVQHGVLAGDVVGADGQVVADLSSIAHDVQVERRWLDDDTVGTLVHVPCERSSGETAASWGQLVVLAVSLGWRGVGSVTEWTVQVAGELGRVGHDEGLVRETSSDQAVLDVADTAVDHVGGRYTVGTGTGVVHSNSSNTGDTALTVDGAVVVEDTTVAVRSVLAQADIADDVQFGESGTQDLDTLDNRALGVVSSSSDWVLSGRVQGNTKQNNRAQTLGNKRSQVLYNLVDTETLDVWQRGNRLLVISVVRDEQWEDEHVLAELALALPLAQQRMVVSSSEDRRNLSLLNLNKVGSVHLDLDGLLL